MSCAPRSATSSSTTSATSYGTAIGAAYAELFPSSVGRVALDSAQDPTLTRSETADAQFAYRESRLRAYLDSCLDQATAGHRHCG